MSAAQHWTSLPRFSSVAVKKSVVNPTSKYLPRSPTVLCLSTTPQRCMHVVEDAGNSGCGVHPKLSSLYLSYGNLGNVVEPVKGANHCKCDSNASRKPPNISWP